MADKGIEVKIGADTSEATSGVQEASQSIADSLSKISDALENFGGKNTDTMKEAIQNNADLSRSFVGLHASIKEGFDGTIGVIQRFRGVLGSLAAALASGFVFKASVDAAMQLEDTVRGLEIVFGMSAEAAQKQAVALKIAGVEASSYEQMGLRMSRSLRTQQDEWERLGVTIKDEHGNLLPLDQIMQNLYQRMQDFKAGTDQDMVVMELAGRSAKDFASDMQRLNAAQKDAEEYAKRFALAMGPGAQQSVEEYRRKMNEFDLELEHLKVTLGIAVLPLLEKLTGWFATGVDVVSSGIHRLAAASTAQLQQMEGAVVGVKNQIASLPGTIDTALAAFRKMEHEGPPVPGSGKETYKPKPEEDSGKDALAAMKAELDDMNLLNGAFHQLSKQNEVEFWEEKLATVKGYGKQEVELRREINHEILRASIDVQKEDLANTVASIHEQEEADRNNKDAQIRDAQGFVALMKGVWGEESADYKKALDEELKIRAEWAKKEEAMVKDAEKFHIDTLKATAGLESQYLSGEVAAGRLSAAQKIETERGMEETIYQAELEAADNYIATLQVGTLAYQQAMEKRLNLTIEYNSKMLSLAQAAEADREQYAKQADQAIESSLGTLMDNLVNRTTTLKKAFTDFFNSLDQQLVKIAGNEVMKQFMGSGTQGGSALSSLTSKIFGSGGGAQAATETANTAAVTALTAALTANTAALASNTAASAGGGILGSQSIGGTGFGLGGLIPGFETGTPYVPQTSLAVVHRGEAIIPAGQNRRGGGSVSVSNHFSMGGPTDSRTQAQIAKAAARGVHRATRRG